MRNLNLKFFTVIIFSMMLAGCSENQKTETQYLDDAKTKLDEKKYAEAITEYKEFIKNYPKSDQAIFAYNQIAGIQIENLKNPQEGINTYKELAEKYPSTKDAKQALFMVAFMYDETLKDKDNAIKSYQAFLEKYPTDTDANDKMSESARTMLDVLQSGKSIEEIIQQNIDKMGNQPNTDTLTTGQQTKEENVKPLDTKKKGELSDPSEKKKADDESKQ